MPFTWTESTSVGTKATVDSYEEMYDNLEYVMVNLLNMGGPTHAIKPVKGAQIAPITFNLLRSDVDDAYDKSLITNCSSFNSSVEGSNDSTVYSSVLSSDESSDELSDHSTHQNSDESSDESSNYSGNDESKYIGYNPGDNSAYDEMHYYDNETSEYKTVYNFNNTSNYGPDS